MKRSWSPDAGAPGLVSFLGLGVGIAAGVALPVSPAPPLAVLGLVLACVASIRGLASGKPLLSRAGGFLVFAAIGYHGGRIRFALPARHDEAIARSLGSDAPVEVVGRLSAPWSASGSLRRTRIAVESATASGRPVALARDIVLVVAGATDPFLVADRGDRVRVESPLTLPDAAGSDRSPFDLPLEPRLTLKSALEIERRAGPAGALGFVDRARHALRARLEENLASASPGERRALSLVLALLIGETEDVLGETSSVFRDGGVAHVLSISGLHVGLVVLFAHAVLTRLRLSIAARDATLLALTLLYAVFAGGRPPVFRSALMIGFYLLARLLGRPTSPGQVLGLSGTLLLLATPEDLFDVGFLLTFAAVFGLGAFATPLSRALTALRFLPALLADLVGSTLAAELMVFPVQAFVFNVVPFVAVLSNVLVVPLAGAFLGLSLVSMPLLVAAPFLAKLAIVPLRILSDVMLLVLQLLDRLHASRFVPAPSFALAVSLSGLLLVAALSQENRTRFCALVASGALVLVILLRPATREAPGAVRLQALDVGQGDSWALVTNRGRILVDGGGTPDAAYEFGRSRLLPLLADRGLVSFEAVILSHPHPDHSRGLLAVLGVARVGRLVLPRGAPRNVFLDEILSAASRRGVPVARMGSGENLDVAGLRLEVLHPGEETYPRSKENNGSLVFRVAAAGRTVLMTGDIEGPAEHDLLAPGRDFHADVLKVPHHGSRTSTTPELLAAVSPRVGLIGVGRRNRFGHPNPDVLARLSAARVRVLRTDRDRCFALRFEAGHVFPVFDTPARSSP